MLGLAQVLRSDYSENSNNSENGETLSLVANETRNIEKDICNELALQKMLGSEFMNDILSGEKDYTISNDLKLSYTLINSAQATLSDLDKSISELSNLVNNLKKQSDKLLSK